MEKIVFENVLNETAKKYAEYAEEFKKAEIFEEDENHYIYQGDKHFFDFVATDDEVKLYDVFDIVYFDDFLDK